MTGETRLDSRTTAARPRVYVHLPIEQDAEAWRKWHAVGLGAEVTPYGYHHAEQYGFDVAFSRSRAESALVRLARRALHRLLGFDVIHAWRNREGLRRCAAVWTYTEAEWLAVLLLFALPGFARTKRPKVIAQTIWLFDTWATQPAPLRWLYRTLMRQADVLTTHSPLNVEVPHRLCPEVPSRSVRYGISFDPFLGDPSPRAGTRADLVRVVAAGNDTHRDWVTLLEAVRGRTDIELTIMTPKSAKVASLAAGMPNVQVRHTRSFLDMKAAYHSADVMVIPLKANLHASGITCMLEAAASGVPIICARTGGLDTYFGEAEIVWVPPSDPAALLAAIDRLKGDPATRIAFAVAARERLLAEDYSSARFVLTHCELTRDLLGIPTNVAAANPIPDMPARRPSSQALRTGASSGSVSRKAAH